MARQDVNAAAAAVVQVVDGAADEADEDRVEGVARGDSRLSDDAEPVDQLRLTVRRAGLAGCGPLLPGTSSRY